MHKKKNSFHHEQRKNENKKSEEERKAKSTLYPAATESSRREIGHCDVVTIYTGYNYVKNRYIYFK